jgi:hypothetical protein
VVDAVASVADVVVIVVVDAVADVDAVVVAKTKKRNGFL